ncbi:MAG: hypothetical protein ACP5UA_13995 [Candidatus Hydrogenedens sp.]
MEMNEQKRRNPIKWEPKDFWLQYIGSMTPSAFLKISGVYSPYRAVEKHLQKLSTFYGIVRRNTWKETFGEPLQFSYEEVYWGIIAYLKETENEWKQEWREFWLAKDDEDPLDVNDISKPSEN